MDSILQLSTNAKWGEYKGLYLKFIMFKVDGIWPDWDKPYMMLSNYLI